MRVVMLYMKKQAIITTSLCALLAMPLVHADTTPQPVQQVLQAIAEGAHPFYDKGMYPDWSKLTPEQARIDSEAAMVLARHRRKTHGRNQSLPRRIILIPAASSFRSQDGLQKLQLPLYQ